MVLEKFNNLCNLILETFKAVGYKKIYSINDETFTPFVYKNIYVCASALNNDKNHAIIRLLKRTKYTLDDLFNLIKDGIDEFYKNKYQDLFNKSTKFEKTEQNFVILSKSKPDIKICILISKNTAYDLFKNEHKEFHTSKYICFIHTILDEYMIPHSNDIKIFIEEVKNEIELNVK